MAQTIASLAIRLDVESAQLKKQLDDVTKSVKAMERETSRATRENIRSAQEFQAALTKTAAVAVAAGAAIVKAMSFADDIADTADAFDIAIGSVVGFRNALALSGGKADNLATSLQKLANVANSAKEGTDSAREAFDKLGISGADVDKLGLDDLFSRVAQALSQVDDPIKRNALAFEVLGKAAKGVDWKKYWEEYGQGTKTSEELAEAIKVAAEAWDNLVVAGKKAIETLLVLLAPLFNAINYIAKALKNPPTAGATDTFAAEFGGDLNAALGFTPAPPPVSIEPNKGTTSKLPPPARAGGYKEPPKSAEGFAAQTEAVRQQTMEYVRLTGLAIRRQQIESETINMTANQRELYMALNKIEEDRVALLQKANAAIAEEEKQKKPNTEKIAELRQQIIVINELKNAEKTAIEEIILKRQEEQYSFESGWNRAFRQYAEDAQNYSRFGQEAFSSVVGNMDRALSNFVQTGKLNFKEFAASIIQDLIRIQLRMQMMQMFSAGKSFLGSLFSGGQGDISRGISYQGAADGGYINSPTIVGEVGPELFIPRTAGTVVPNQQLSSFMGGQPQVVYNGPYIANLQAIDTQSATQFLAKNKQAVWSANQSASRSMPTSR